jgi:hypothetical protein
VVRLDGRFVGVEADSVADLIAAARAELGLTAAARERFRMNLLRRFYADYSARLGGLAVRAFDEIERSLRKDGRLNRFLERVWPSPRPEQLGSWGDVLRHLPGADRAEIEELSHAYRVPREIMELSLPLLERIAPGVQPPLAYRVGAASPRVVLADPPLPAAFEEAARLGGEEGLLVVIAPNSLSSPAGTRVAIFDETRIPVLTPREAKGLEFDHVIVVEPALIVAEAAEGQGLRELYVALTRPTRTLVVVHARPLPPEPGLP